MVSIGLLYDEYISKYTYFLLEKCENLLHCIENLLHYKMQKILACENLLHCKDNSVFVIFTFETLTTR